MHSIRRILVAIKNPAATSFPAAAKAAQIARALGADLELFHAITEPIQVTPVGLAQFGLAHFANAKIALRVKQLERGAARLRRSRVAITTIAEFDFPSYEAILRRAQLIKAGLIVVQCLPHRRFARAYLRFTDWELLRLSPIPVLLVKHPGLYRPRPVVLAAIDPTQAFSKPVALDTEILRLSTAITNALHGTLHAVHAYVPHPLYGFPVGVPSQKALAQIARESAAQARIEFSRAVRTADIPPAHRHLIGRHPIDAIQGVARRTRSGLVVMGAVSRSGLKRVIIGNTAEALLDALPCDLLIVKPGTFRHPVGRAKRGPHSILTV